jgi:hypothetical protein
MQLNYFVIFQAICLKWFGSANNDNLSKANCNTAAKLKCQQVTMAHARS